MMLAGAVKAPVACAPAAAMLLLPVVPTRTLFLGLCAAAQAGTNMAAGSAEE